MFSSDEHIFILNTKKYLHRIIFIIIFEYQNKTIMKTTVLGYSKNGVYVEVENGYASVVFDFNTTTKDSVEVGLTEWIGKEFDDCEYQLSKSEIESLTEAFNFLVY